VVKDRIYNGRFKDYNRTYDGQLYVHNRLGLQQAIYTDSYFQLDFEEKLLETLEVMKSIVLLENLQGWYSLDGSRPVAVFELSLGNEGKYSKRIAFTILDVFEQVGGLQIVIFSVTIFISNLLSDESNKIELIKLFKISDCNFFNFSFIARSFCVRNICCKSKSCFNKSFQIDFEKYESHLEQIDNHLSF
jgi:hypothetical protein